MSLESVAMLTFTLGIALAFLGFRLRWLRPIAAVSFAVSVASIIGYVAWVYLGPPTHSATCYDGYITDCNFGATPNQVNPVHALVLILFFVVANIGGFAILRASRKRRSTAARI